MSKITRFGVSLPDELLQRFDRFLAKKENPTRSKAIADIIREELKKDSLTTGKQGTGAILLVYDHHKRELVNTLTNIQHQFHHMVICNQHIHLDHHDCLEIIVIKGIQNEMVKLTNTLKSVKGVKYGALNIATTKDIS